MAVKSIIVFNPCCNTGGSGITFEGDIPTLIPNTVYIYTGPIGIVGSGNPGSNELIPGQCYTVLKSTVLLSAGPYVPVLGNLDPTYFTLDPVLAKDCNAQYCIDACGQTVDNNWSPRFLTYTPCCGGQSFYFRLSDIDGYYPGTLPSTGVAKYMGLLSGSPYTATDGDNNPVLPGLIAGTCYSITSSVVGPTEFITSTAEYNNLQLAPPDDNNNYVYLSNTNTNCDAYINECPSCNTTCYALWSCDGSIPVFTTNVDLSAYVGLNIVVSSVDPADGIESLCVFVEQLEDTTCTDAIDITIDPVIYCDCECTCYTITGQAKSINYIDCDGNFVQITNPPAYNKFCAKAYPLVDAQVGTQIIIINNGNCSEQVIIDPITCDESVQWVCPKTCYKLIDCTNPTNIIYSTTSSLQNIVLNNQIITIDGFEECWSVELSDEICDCPIDVSILTVSDCCRQCQGNPNYIVTSCDGSNIFNYTTDDLSQYVGQSVIRDDCGGCWVVEKFDGQIPSYTKITILDSFINCEACLATYYYLIDCNNPNNVIQTISNLSDTLGFIIKLDWYKDTCWSISTTRPLNIEDELINTIPDVSSIITNVYTDCTACITNAKCICSTIKNYNTFTQTYQYVNCYGQVQTVTLLPGQKSERTCLINWLVPKNCESFILTVNSLNYTLVKSNIQENGKPVYLWFSDPEYIRIQYDGAKWVILSSYNFDGYYLSCTQDCDCPIGDWHNDSSIPSDATVSTVEFLYTIEEFGECINGTCPPRKYTKKSVRPGYNTPACETWKYEEISCRAAEALYKHVLTLRYGISNCCPEDDEQYIIQKELVDLQALIPPAKITPAPPPPLVSTIYTTFKAI